MKHFILAAILVIAPMAVSAAPLTLNGNVRDFIGYGPNKHPDFQRAIDGVRPGMIQSSLDADGKPVLNGSPNGSFTNQANFSQWYRDVQGVNQSMALSIDLNETAPGSKLFRYSSNSFFPIDNLLFGNEGQSHNYHFTYEIKGKTAFTATDTFAFTGDDDLWVFIGDELMIDLGGVHGAASASFNGNDLIAKGLEVGKNYNFRVFFAERHTTESNFSITTSLPIDSSPAPVPLPAAGLLLLGGIGLLAAAKRKRT